MGYDRAAGDARRTWRTAYANLACRVQPRQSTVQDERGITGAVTSYRVYLSRQITIDVRESRVLWGRLTLDVVAYEQSERVDELPFLDVALNP